MQITNEKPTIDPVIKACLMAKRQEIEQKDRSNAIFEMHSCFRELETANFETLNPEMKHLISFNTSTGWTAEPCFCPLAREDWN